MTDETIFNNKEQDQNSGDTSDQQQSPNNQQQVDLNAIFQDRLSGITNDNGEPKYKDVYTALEALKHSQDYIRTLETENKGFKEELTKHETLEEAFNRLNSTNTNQNTDNTNSKKEIDVETLRRLVREEAELSSKETRKQQNSTQVSSELVKKFGDVDKAKKAFQDKAEELGVTFDFLSDLASNSPKAVLAYFQTTQNTTFSKNIQGSVNTSSTNQEEVNKPKIGGIMHGSSTQDVLSAWRAAKDAVLSENN